MNFLKELKYLGEAEDLTELPHDVYSELENHIHKGAKDMDKEIVNALELVKEAYKVENVDLPNPAMKKGWEQFTKLLEYATAKLLKFRGIEGDWRMSSHVFHESINNTTVFKITLENGDKQKTVKVKDSCIEDVANDMQSALTKLSKSNEVRIKYDGKTANLSLWQMKVRQPLKITIKEV